MKTNSTTYITIAGIVLLVIFGFFLTKIPKTNFTPSVEDSYGQELIPFASCLKDAGVTFYGAFWCPHCASQKKLFGAAVKSLPYVECSTPDGQGVLPVCQAANVTGYPTWNFKDGSRVVKEMTLEELSAKSGCSLDGKSTASTSATSTIKSSSTAEQQ